MVAEPEVLKVSGLTVQRGGRDVVRNVDVEIPAGEVTALLGPNGAGKSSIVLAVGGILRPQAGSIELGDQDFAGKRPERIRRAGVAIVPEGRRLLPELTVEENIRVATYTLPRAQAAAGRARALELFPELKKRLDAPARALSGGEQQMVVLAQALVSQPKFILIDELSLGLAPVVVNRLIPTIRDVAESGIGVLLIEQFVTVALGLANGAHVMEGGRIQYSGSAKELRDDPSCCTRRTCCAGATAPLAPLRWRPPAAGMTAGVTALEHVLVLSDDIDAARHFYERAVGLTAGDRPPLQFDGYWLYAGDVPCLHIADRAAYEVARADAGPDRRRAGRSPRSGPVDHIAFSASTTTP